VGAQDAQGRDDGAQAERVAVVETPGPDQPLASHEGPVPAAQVLEDPVTTGELQTRVPARDGRGVQVDRRFVAPAQEVIALDERGQSRWPVQAIQERVTAPPPPRL
jgi:hypothetical protein